MGWEPAAPDSWVDPSGVEWQITLGACVDLKPFEKIVKKHEEARMWAKAAEHHNGKGLEHGCAAWINTRQHSRLQRKYGAETAGLFSAISTGALWTAQRSRDNLYQVDLACVFCGEAGKDNEKHRCWECPVVCQGKSPGN